ncbi:hypothetical protein HC031_31960 [Planosporangium thailandense]|uniref:Cyanate hydratase N-terminal domain-containing protein n=1 Tax=Planosporangium thailandense TaxID=765197 RepID=A0ABX0Y772_9ACTN|nr:hypothetical protein [Planosporangium thailandense]NJC74296.1 hypothetical protein [Planosporangium thailandense]
MTREEIARAVMAAKLERGLSWQELADSISKPVTWVAAALLGQHSLAPADAMTLATKLGLPERVAPILSAARAGDAPGAAPADPTIGRLYEVLRIYEPR